MTNKRQKTKPVSLKIVGLILAGSYQRSRLFAERLHKHHKMKFLAPSITGLLDMDWADYIHKLRKEVGGRTWAVKDSVVVFLNDSVLGGEADFFDHFRDYFYKSPSAEKIKEFAEKEYVEYLNRGNLIYTFMELSAGDEYMGSLLFQLKYDVLPKSCLWFTEFCTHDRFTYRGTKIHRVCKRGWFQAGEMPSQREWSLKSLDDEGYSYHHDRRGIVSFANEGKHTNRFQFLVTFGPADWMDGKYVAFGRVVEGSDVLRRIECTPCTYESPDKDIVITNCGIARVGLGRAIDPSLRLKGITVGLPHLHLEFFVDLLFEEFDRILYDRLDEEVKKLIGGGWIMEMVWERVIDRLTKKRPPAEDELDARDRSSRHYLAERYIAGLYSLPDIPDLFIKKLLDEAVQKAIDKSDVQLMAISVVDFLVNISLDKATIREQVVEEVIHSLVEKVLNIIFGSEYSLGKGSSSSMLGITKALCDVSSLKKSLSDLKKRVGLEAEEDAQTSEEQLSTRESVAAFIWGMLLEMLQNITNGE